MRSVLKVTMVQMCSELGDKERNCEKTLKAISSSDSDIICFPEASLTGYTSREPMLYAVDKDDDLIGKICKASSEKGIVTVFGFIENNGGMPMVAQAVADNGKISIYRKTHLGVSERSAFFPGNTIEPITTSKAKIGLVLCWESHFPEISTLLALKGARLLLMPFASPLNAEQRVENWKRHLPARAYDNGVCVGACNSVKGDSGGALFIDKDGTVIAERTVRGENELTVDIDISPRIRCNDASKMHGRDFLASRRPELYDGSIRR